MLAELHQIKTKDGLRLEGLFFKPKRRGRVAAFWVGGLSSRFSSNPTRLHALARAFVQRNIAFAAFDHRSCGIINSIRKSGKKKSILGGAAFERFENSLYDIDAVVRFLRSNGFRKIFLFGSSTGATKAAYYIWKKKGSKLSGVGLLGAISDVPIFKRDLGRNYQQALAIAERLVRRKKGSELMPRSIVPSGFWTAARFLSIAREGQREDTFPYYNPKRHFYWAKRVSTPLLVLIGAKDQYRDRPVSEIMSAFRREIPPQHFTGLILPGATHSFTGKEKELARILARWIARQSHL